MFMSQTYLILTASRTLPHIRRHNREVNAFFSDTLIIRPLCHRNILIFSWCSINHHVIIIGRSNAVREKLRVSLVENGAGLTIVVTARRAIWAFCKRPEAAGVEVDVCAV